MSRAQHRDGLAGIARAVSPQHVRHPVGNPVRRLLFADGAETVGAGRIWRMPGAGGVDDGIGSDNPGTLAVLIANFEGGGFAAFGLELVEADTADVGDAAGGVDVCRENSFAGERFAIALPQFGAG